jgi:hypothetical protein
MKTMTHWLKQMLLEADHGPGLCPLVGRQNEAMAWCVVKL